MGRPPPLLAALLLLLLLAAGAAPARAEDDADDDEAILDAPEERLEIIASRPLEEAPTAAVDEVSREDIEAAGARTAADALRLAPGVTVETGEHGDATLQVRGFGTRQVQVLVDGVPLSDPYDAGLDLASISASSIDSIRVTRGAGTSTYGGSALGGTVEIETTGPTEDPTFRLRGGGGTFHDMELLAAGSAGLGPVRVGLAWELRNRPFERLPGTFPAQRNEDGGRRKNSDRRDQTLHAAVAVGDELHGLQLRGTIRDVRRGVPPEISDPSPRWWRWDLWRDQLLVLDGHTHPSARIAVHGATFVRFREDTLDAFDDGSYATQEGPDAWTSSYRDLTAGGSGRAEFDLGRENLIGVALTYRHDRHRDRGDLDQEWQRRDGDTATLAPSATLRPAQPLTVEIGAGLHLWQPRDAEEAEHRAPVFTADPRVGAALRIAPELAVRVSGGRRSRFPTLKEMYTSEFGYVVPNPDLRSEHAWTVDAGVSLSPWERRLVLDVSGYVAPVRDLIERTYDAEGNRLYTNVSRSRHAGVEVRVIARPHRTVEIEAGYDALHARNTSEERTSDLLEYRPAHRARLRGHLRAPFGLGVDLVFTAVGVRHYAAVEATGEMKTLPAYIRLDANLRQELGKGFSIYVRGTNLTDTLYEEEVGYPRPGIRVTGGVEFAGSARAPGGATETPGSDRVDDR